MPMYMAANPGRLAVACHWLHASCIAISVQKTRVKDSDQAGSARSCEVDSRPDWCLAKR